MAEDLATADKTMRMAASETDIFIGGGGPQHDLAQSLLLKYGNRHGLIAGATGTGKTVTLQIMAEGFSAAGVPVFLADVKGDLSGLAASGSPEHKLHGKLISRAEKIGFDGYGYAAQPTIFWDVFGEQGHPIRARVSEIGPVILSRLLDLNEVQEGVLNVVFRKAEDDGLEIVDLKDLRSMLTMVAESAKELTASYGSVSRMSVGAIQRRLLVLENQGARSFFGEPALSLEDLMRKTGDGRGMVSVLAADKLMRSPRLYATFLFWLLSKLYNTLPEVGDADRPKLAFFFDEAHLLFDDAPRALIEQVEQVARLIRSKGVGVYFVTQNPADVPDTVLGQLGNRVQHALRAYTPRDQKALRAAAETFRPNPDFDAEEVLPTLGVGEALVSTLDAKGAPTIVQRTLIRPPSSRLGPLTPEERSAVMQTSPVADLYDEAVDRKTAFEALEEKRRHAAEEAAREIADAENGKSRKTYNKAEAIDSKPEKRSSRSVSTAEKAVNSGFNAFLKSITGRLGRRLAKVVFSMLAGGRR